MFQKAILYMDEKYIVNMKQALHLVKFHVNAFLHAFIQMMNKRWKERNKEILYSTYFIKIDIE